MPWRLPHQRPSGVPPSGPTASYRAHEDWHPLPVLRPGGTPLALPDRRGSAPTAPRRPGAPHRLGPRTTHSCCTAPSARPLHRTGQIPVGRSLPLHRPMPRLTHPSWRPVRPSGSLSSPGNYHCPVRERRTGPATGPCGIRPHTAPGRQPSRLSPRPPTHDRAARPSRRPGLTELRHSSHSRHSRRSGSHPTQGRSDRSSATPGRRQ